MRVLIVTGYGDDLYTHSDAANFFNYLVKEVGISKNRILFYGPAEYEAKINFFNIFAQVCRQSKNDPLIIYYSGHGLSDGWSFKDNTDIPYGLLVHFLKNRNAPVMLINDCCFGMIAAEYFKELKCHKLVIGLSPKNLSGQTDDEFGSILLPEVFKFWRRYSLAFPRFKIDKKNLPEEMRDEFFYKMISHLCLRCGDGLDALLFPQKRYEPL
jgi:hypothetical protein